MSALLKQAEQIMDVAAAGTPGARNTAIVIDPRGGMRMLDPSGWNLAAMSAEFGASAVYRIERRGSTVRVEGISGSERCLIQRDLAPRSYAAVGPWSRALLCA